MPIKTVAVGFIGAMAGALVVGSALGAHAATPAAGGTHTVSPSIVVTPGWECVPTTAGQAVVSGGTGAAPSCGGGTTAVLAPTYVASGLGGKPTAEFSSINVQVVSGSGSTSGPVNGEGNLVVGYAENTSNHSRTGSNNLVVGSENGWTSYGALVGGFSNQAIGKYDAVVGGDNIARGGWTLVGGQRNQARGSYSSVTGGHLNYAAAPYASIAGGCLNAVGSASTLTGICNPGAGAVLGGFENLATGADSTVSGGEENIASGILASVSGGADNDATSNCQTIPAAPGSC